MLTAQFSHHHPQCYLAHNLLVISPLHNSASFRSCSWCMATGAMIDLLASFYISSTKMRCWSLLSSGTQSSPIPDISCSSHPRYYIFSRSHVLILPPLTKVIFFAPLTKVRFLFRLFGDDRNGPALLVNVCAPVYVVARHYFRHLWSRYDFTDFITMIPPHFIPIFLNRLLRP